MNCSQFKHFITHNGPDNIRVTAPMPAPSGIHVVPLLGIVLHDTNYTLQLCRLDITQYRIDYKVICISELTGLRQRFYTRDLLDIDGFEVDVKPMFLPK